MLRSWTLAAMLTICLAGSYAVAAPKTTAEVQTTQIEDATLAAKFDRLMSSVDVAKPDSIRTLLLLEPFDTLIDPHQMRDAYKKLADKATNPSLKRYASWKYASVQAQLGETFAPIPGELDAFFVSYPFENSSIWGFSQPFEPEKGFDTTKALSEAKFDEAWQTYKTASADGILKPQEVVYIDDFGVIYMATRIQISDQIKKPVKARLELSSATPITAWMNGDAVAHHTTVGASFPAVFGKTWNVTLKPGENILVIKVAALESKPAIRAFLTDEKGAPIDFKLDLSKPIQSTALAEVGDKLQGTDSLYETWIKDSALPAPVRAILANQVLEMNDAEAQSRDLIMRDKETIGKMPTDDVLLSVAAVNDNWMKVEILREARKHHPNDKWLNHAWANAVINAAGDQSSPIKLTDVLPDLKQYTTASFDPMLISLLQASIEKAARQNRMARNTMDKAAGNHNNVSWLSTYLSTIDDADIDARHAILTKLYAMQKTSAFYLTELCQQRLYDARAAHDDATLAEALVLTKHDIDEYMTRDPYDESIWEYWLDIVDAYAIDVLADKGYDIGAFDRAGWHVGSDAEYARWLEMRPNDPDRWQRYAAFSTRMGDTQNSATAYAMAANLRPQDEALRDRSNYKTEVSVNQEHYETPYLLTDIPANRDASATSHVSLLDQRITRILPNGLKSTYSQLVFEIIDEAGIRALRAVPLNYSPTDENIEIVSVTTTKKDGTVKRVFEKSEYDVADPSIRMYYDQRQIVIQIPDLSVGDRVEFQFRRTETHRAASSIPFFGDILQLQTSFNKQWTRYIVIAPKSFPVNFYRTTPDVKGFEAPVMVSDVGDETVSMFETTDTPRVLMEGMTPGMTEVVPFLYVSSFKTWQQVADWFIELAKPQWVADDMIRAEVKRLTEGVTDHREIVKRIYNYVLRETRYVALEFGIHGHKPYPVPQIFQRKFGDCKDKASLLKVMLEAAGVETKFVLARTRQNGDIDGEMPSPYLFDHAIVYVPEFDMFLDGTAEFSGSTELPVLDQDAFVLIVNDDATYQIRKTAMTTNDDNVKAIEATYDLTQQDTVKYTTHAMFKGFMAPSYRIRYGKTDENENTKIQLERLKSEVAYTIPGSEIISANFGDIDNIEKPIDIQYEATTSFSDVAKSDGADSFKVMPLVKSVELTRQYTSGAERKLPLIVPLPITFDEKASVIVPAGKAASLPSDTHLSNAFGSFDLIFEQTGNGFTTHAVVKISKTRIEPSEYKAWQDFLQSIDHALNAPIVIR